MLVDAKEILVRAKEEKYGIASPTIWDEVVAKKALAIAEKLQAPMILGYVKGYGSEEIIESRRIFDLAEKVRVPVSVIQDHGRNYEDNIWGIHAGLPFVMIDRSDLPFEENLALTKEFVKIAHTAKIYVEGEVGRTGSKSGHYEGIPTDVEEAKRYEKETNVDAIAVTVGNLHGYKAVQVNIDFNAVDRLREALTVPMTTHGSSGIPFETLTKMAKGGITKFNMQTHLSVYSVDALEKYLIETRGTMATDHRKRQLKTVSEFVYEQWGDELTRYVNALGSNGKTWI
jgi:fructose-bisphosphate aldolase class II